MSIIFFTVTKEVNFDKEVNNVFGQSTCMICQEDFEYEERVTMIKQCSHLFHKDCLLCWYDRNQNCPICKQSLKIDDYDTWMAQES